MGLAGSTGGLLLGKLASYQARLTRQGHAGLFQAFKQSQICVENDLAADTMQSALDEAEQKS